RDRTVTGVQTCALPILSHKMFSPRVGLAWRLNDTTVIRTGYGITRDPMPLSRPLRGFYPLTVGDTFTQANTYAPYDTLAQGIPRSEERRVGKGANHDAR